MIMMYKVSDAVLHDFFGEYPSSAISTKEQLEQHLLTLNKCLVTHRYGMSTPYTHALTSSDDLNPCLPAFLLNPDDSIAQICAPIELDLVYTESRRV